MVAGVTGCSNDTGSAADKEPAASSSTTADSEKAKKREQQDGSAAAQPSAVRQSTAEGAVAAWVTAVIKGQPKQACLLMGEPAADSSPARAGTPSRCNSNAPEVRQMQDNIGKFRTSFMPEPPTNNPKVEVATVPVTGDKAMVPADKVTVDGQTLDKIILSHSTGLESGQLDVKVESTKIADAWYVTNLDFNVG
ncbi:hypothetical protein G5C60_11720 [Streptomyces sp. HC44]|uniref:Uncharacterized protein n=2 Tax=Streptomyces scabichelini TaxID=2711217 RepID=A0A6G4V2T6_9ACTN|nr:hypothetical protein [Streptomyces scabichelini]NGO08281.1 hypothetical protein [Streptomyces scabichelini]